MESDPTRIAGIPLTRHWLIPRALGRKVYIAHSVMSADEIRRRTQQVWDRFYRLPAIWRRSRMLKTLRARLAFVLISKLYRQMYANTGIATDSARGNRSVRWAQWLAKPCLRLFQAPSMPELQVPTGVSPQPAWPLDEKDRALAPLQQASEDPDDPLVNIKAYK